MARYQAPGVYTEEISKLPPSIAQVPTGIPIFIAYTEMVSGAATQRITSLLTYQQAFGKSDYLTLYFANGGGPCYIISVGLTTAPVTAAVLLAGLAIAATIDEPALIVIPQVHLLPSLADALNVYNAALLQASNRRDRFVILDCHADDIASIRNPGLAGNLSYCAAYYPFLKVGALTIPPSSAIAGVYAATDNARGVWKAPANVSLNTVTGVTKTINNLQQDGLNVDAVTGKSINAIRPFTGKGIMVWGARTLAGNDNNWRYVSVRRFFIMAEESIRNAMAQFIFEPNDANTWVKIKAMIENYLTILWRQGALTGTKPQDAFYVSIGLNKTMTAIDILEGRLIAEIGLAPVRPAEFIIVKIAMMIQSQ